VYSHCTFLFDIDFLLLHEHVYGGTRKTRLKSVHGVFECSSILHRKRILYTWCHCYTNIKHI